MYTTHGVLLARVRARGVTGSSMAVDNQIRMKHVIDGHHVIDDRQTLSSSGLPSQSQDIVTVAHMSLLDGPLSLLHI